MENYRTYPGAMNCSREGRGNVIRCRTFRKKTARRRMGPRPRQLEDKKSVRIFPASCALPVRSRSGTPSTCTATDRYRLDAVEGQALSKSTGDIAAIHRRRQRSADPRGCRRRLQPRRDLRPRIRSPNFFRCDPASGRTPQFLLAGYYVGACGSHRKCITTGRVTFSHQSNACAIFFT